MKNIRFANIYMDKDGAPFVEVYSGGIMECLREGNLNAGLGNKVLAVAVEVDYPEVDL